MLRDALPERRIEISLGGGHFKTQFRRADRSGARVAVVIGDDELARGVVRLKPLREEGAQCELAPANLTSEVRRLLGA